MAGLTIKQMAAAHGVGQKQPISGDAILGESASQSFFWSTVDQLRDTFGLVGDTVFPGDADFTVNGQQRVQVIEYSTALTAHRTVTLQSAGNAKTGDVAIMIRTSSAGATFNVLVTGLYSAGTVTETFTSTNTGGPER